MKKFTAAVLCSALLIIMLFSGCGASSKSDRGSGNWAMDTSSPSGMEMYYNSGEAGMSYEDMAPEEPQSQAAPTVEELQAGGSTATISQKLIYTVNLSIETLDYEASLSAVEELTKRYGGYIEYADVDNNRIREYDLRMASFTLRIPAKSLDEFEKSSGDIGSIYNSSRKTENATAQYIDLTARLDNYRAEEETLRGLLLQAQDIETIIALNTRLTEVRYQIESVESSLRNIDSLVSYSTVNIYLYEVVKQTAVVEEVPRTFGERVAARMKNTTEYFVSEMEYIGIYVFGELPLALVLFVIRLIPLIIIVGVVWIIWRAIRNKRRRDKIEMGIPVKPTRKERKAAKKQARGMTPGGSEDNRQE